MCGGGGAGRGVVCAALAFVLCVCVCVRVTGLDWIGLMIAYIALFSALLSRLTALACGATVSD